VLSVGNLTVGGTGKTPLVEWLLGEIRLLGLNPAVLTRGYGARDGEEPDELRMMAKNFPGLHAVRDPDRVRGALEAIERHCAEALVLDDGFQHLRLARQLDMVAVDATAPFGGGHCLPRGTLREPPRGLRRAQVVVVTRSDQVPPEWLDRVSRRVRRLAPRATVAFAVHRPCDLEDIATGALRPASWLTGRGVVAVSGIGNPAAFERTLAGLGARVLFAERFPDHHHHDPATLGEIGRKASAAGAEAIVTTGKDAVKWPVCPVGKGETAGLDALKLGVRIEFTEGVEEVRRRIREALSLAVRREPAGTVHALRPAAL
jgi:tetraacyldisaccharide 4'-kinase